MVVKVCSLGYCTQPASHRARNIPHKTSEKKKINDSISFVLTPAATIPSATKKKKMQGRSGLAIWRGCEATEDPEGR